MKKFITIIITLIILFGACDNMFESSEFTGKGNVEIYLSNNGARTILPSQYDLSALYYKLIFTNVDLGNVIVEYLNGGTQVNLDVAAGVYNLQVYGYENEAIANTDTGNTGAGALFSGLARENPFSVSGRTIINVVLQPNAILLNQTEGKSGILQYEIIIPAGASGILEIENNETVILNTATNRDSINLASGDYSFLLIIKYNDKIKVVREIVQVYDNAVSLANYRYVAGDFINAASVAITNVVVDKQVGEIEINDTDITVMVHFDMINSLSSIAPEISFIGAMITPITPQDFSNEARVPYTVYSENGEVTVFYITIKIAAETFTSAPQLRVKADDGSANYEITKPSPDADSLTLYYAKGDFETAEEILNAGGVSFVEIDSDAKLNGTVLDLDNNYFYSFVVEAEKEHYDASYSVIRKVKPSIKKHLTQEDFDWNGASVSYNGNSQPVMINATSVNGAYTEINPEDIIIHYRGISPTVYSSITPPVNTGNYNIEISVEETESFTQAINIPLDGIYEITAISFTQAPVLQDLSSGPGAGELSYTITASEPEAGVYALYYAVGDSFANAQAVIDAAGTTGRIIANSLTGTIKGLSNDTTYSVVAVAEKSNYIEVNSDKMTTATLKVFTQAPVLTNDHIYTTAASASSASTTVLRYSFEPSNPPADTYTVYYVTGNTNRDAAWLLNPANTVNKVSVPADELSGTISITANQGVSILITADKDNYATINTDRIFNTAFNNSPNLSAVAMQANEPNQLLYTFANASGPSSGITYTMYYIEGEVNDLNTILINGTAVTPPSQAASRTITEKYNTHYSVVICATHTSRFTTYSVIRTATTGNNVWVSPPNFTTVDPVSGEPNQLIVTFAAANAANPAGSTSYTLYWAPGVEGSPAVPAAIIEADNSKAITPGANAATRTVTGLLFNTTYDFVVVAARADFEPATIASAVVQAKTGNNVFTTLPNFTALELPNLATEPNQFRYTFTAASPAANYKIYYLEGNIDDADRIYTEGTVAAVGPTGNYGTNAVAGTSTSTSNAAHNNNRVFFVPKFNTLYSVIVVAEKEGFPAGKSNIRQLTTGDNNFTTMPVLQSVTLPNPENEATLLRYQFTAAAPSNKVSYTVYYMAGEISDPEVIIADGTAVPGSATAGTAGNAAIRNFYVPNFNTTYSVVVAAERDGFVTGVSNIVTATTGTEYISAKVNAEEIGFNTKITWSFENEKGTRYTPTSDITLTYKYKGIEIRNDKLTNTVINETSKTETFANTVREYTISSSNLIAVTDIVVSAIVGGDLIESAPGKSSDIELRLFNIAYNKASEYGAVELFSHGKSYSSAGGLGPTVQPRGHTIVNYQNGNPVDLYSFTFSLGHGGLSGAGAATQNREWYYDGSTLYARSNGGNTNLSSGGTGATAPVRPSSSWDSVVSVDNDHTGLFTQFVEIFRRNPFGYLSNDINSGYTGIYQYKYTNPTTTSNNFTSGRSDAPTGLIDGTLGALAYNNGAFEFTMSLDADKTGNRVTIIWSGDQNVTAMGNSYITFVIDEDMRFIKYHAMDSYTVQLLSATTYTCVTYYFVYHRDNVNIDGYQSFRAHQLRPNHINFVNTGASPITIVAPYGDIAIGDMVVANSKYDISLDWIRNCTTTVRIP